ncbi:hypothetical protein NPIL_56611 [Nephila pilipes]|uniref:Uncharacterized protein n=1 Tax=Nephila pilipes TaxID=299642 RepID=A0A8X6MMS7_NEPPI|nr:hypothetical protein NPIL_294441 [Nephila pilipes]GFU43366.1 hypothetical protein NPIL_56611 [Nephila pilipes]
MKRLEEYIVLLSPDLMSVILRNTGVDDCFSQSPNRNEPWKKRDHKGYSSFQDEVGRRRAAGIEAFGFLPPAVYGRKYTSCKDRQKTK